MNSTVRRFARHLPVLLLGRPLHGQERYRPFFIVGSGRCGTTLLRAMLQAHPDVHVPPESRLGPVLKDYRRYSRLPWNALLRILLAPLAYDRAWTLWELPPGPLLLELAELPGAHDLATILNALYRAHAKAHKPAAIRWGDKSPASTPVLAELRGVFPDLQVVHMLRDGRDVVRSYMDVSKAGLPHFAEAWLRGVRAARAFGAQHPAQYLEIRYEDLVRDTPPTIARIASFLGLPFDDRMLRYHEADFRLGDVAGHPRLQGVWQPVYQSSIGRWRTGFDESQIAELDRLLGPTLSVLGYSGGESRPSARAVS